MGKGKGKDPEEKSIIGKGESQGGKTTAKVEEENRAAESHYTAMAERGESWGPVYHQREPSYQNSQWKNTNVWEWKAGGWKWKNNSAETNEDARYLGFGEYSDWAYVEAIEKKAMICAGSDRRNRYPIIGKETIRRMEPMERRRNHNGREHGIRRMSSGEHAYSRGEFGFLIIPRGYQEGNHFDEGYQ